MDAETCTTCGALVGDPETHTRWHESGAAPVAAGSAGSGVRRPDTQHPDDPAPYSG